MPKGRPSKLTDEVREAVCEHIRIGATLEIAGRAEGVTPQTMSNWRKWSKGDDAREPFTGFFEDTERARAEFELTTLRRLSELDESDDIKDEETGHWERVNRIDPRVASSLTKSLTWLLERTRRERYGTQITVKVAEAKEHLLDTIERVCGRLGETAVLVAILEELERDGQQEAGEAEGEGQSIVH